ncbi:MAG TPA: hypothetical protein VJ802_02530 [Gemmatimonadaceae bacterium]|nr:hypothetical protein [Gemmatimonadaceae bacterium]
MHIRSILIAAAAAGVLGACAKDDADRAATADSAAEHAGHAMPNVVTVVATDFKFDAPASIPAGLTKFVLKGAGQQIHHATIARLDDGKTVADLQTAFKTPGPPPSWVTFVGGPNVPDPGAEANATVDLAPGNYALICFVDTPDKVPHFAKGMVHGFTVTGAATHAMAPTADVNLVLDDYVFNFDKPLTAGRHTIKVTNPAAQDHEIQLIQLDSGKTLADMQQWITNMSGPPPGRAAGGIASMKPGTTNYFEVDLPAGEYVAICFVPDKNDGKPHFLHGMARQFTVT